MTKHHATRFVLPEIARAKRSNPVPGFDIDAYLRSLNFGRRYVPSTDPVSSNFNMIDAFAVGMLGNRFQEARP